MGIHAPDRVLGLEGVQYGGTEQESKKLEKLDFAFINGLSGQRISKRG